jgi:transposase
MSGGVDGGGALAMSGRERERLVVIAQVCGKVVSRGAAAERLGICVRQVKRLVRAYRAEGDAGLVSRQRGRTSNLRLAPGVGERASELLGGKCRDFGPTLACEKLAELEGIFVSRETIRRLQIRLGLWKPKRRRHKWVFQLRERRPRFGELIRERRGSAKASWRPRFPPWRYAPQAGRTRPIAGPAPDSRHCHRANAYRRPGRSRCCGRN